MSRLVERGNELDALKLQFAECLRGTGRIALVRSSVGDGKTELLQAFTRYAADAGALVLFVGASRDEYGGEPGVVSAVSGRANLPVDVSTRVNRLLEHMCADAGSTTPPVQELAATLLELAECQPIVMAVDDVHHLDDFSLRWLLYLRRSLAGSRSLMVFAEVASLRVPTSAVYVELFDQPSCHHIRLRPLTRQAVTSLLGEHVDAERAVEVAPACHAASGGNPRLVKALIDSGFVAPGDDERVAGTPFRQAILTCLHQLGPDVMAVAAGLAILDGEASAPRVARLMRLTASRVTPAIELLNAAGVLAGDRFRHPDARLAVLDDQPPEARTRLHSRAARLLYDEGIEMSGVVHHLLAADDVGEPWAVGLLRGTAEQALADGAVDKAVRCLGLARRADIGDAERASVLAMLARAEWRRNPLSVVRHIEPMIEAARDGLLSARDTVALVKYLLWLGAPDRAAEVFDQLSRQVDVTDSSITAELLVAHQYVYHGDSPLLERLTRARGQRRTSEMATNSAEMAANVLTLLAAKGPGPQVVAGAEQILLNCRLSETTLESVAGAFFVLLQSDRLDKVATWCSRFFDGRPGKEPDTWWLIGSAVRAELAIRQGDLDQAERHARSMLGAIPAQGWGAAIGAPLADLVSIATARGRLDEAAGLLKRAMPSRMFKTWYGLRYLRARGHYYLAKNQAHAALDDFKRCGNLLMAGTMDLPAAVPWRSDAAQVYLRLGLRAQARELVEQQLVLPAAKSARVRGISLRVLALTDNGPLRAAMLTEAVELLRDSGDHHEMACASADLAAVRQFARPAAQPVPRPRAGQDRPVPELRVPFSPDRKVVGIGSLETVGPQSDGVIDMLSNAERRVAALVVRGHRNREISSRLHITESTVEQHLTRIYRKLGVPNRAALRARFETGSLPGGQSG